MVKISCTAFAWVLLLILLLTETLDVESKRHRNWKHRHRHPHRHHHGHRKNRRHGHHHGLEAKSIMKRSIFPLNLLTDENIENANNTWSWIGNQTARSRGEKSSKIHTDPNLEFLFPKKERNRNENYVEVNPQRTEKGISKSTEMNVTDPGLLKLFGRDPNDVDSEPRRKNFYGNGYGNLRKRRTTIRHVDRTIPISRDFRAAKTTRKESASRNSKSVSKTPRRTLFDFEDLPVIGDTDNIPDSNAVHIRVKRNSKKTRRKQAGRYKSQYIQDLENSFPKNQHGDEHILLNENGDDKNKDLPQKKMGLHTDLDRDSLSADSRDENETDISEIRDTRETDVSECDKSETSTNSFKEPRNSLDDEKNSLTQDSPSVILIRLKRNKQKPARTSVNKREVVERSKRNTEKIGIVERNDRLQTNAQNDFQDENSELDGNVTGGGNLIFSKNKDRSDRQSENFKNVSVKDGKNVIMERNSELSSTHLQDTRDENINEELEEGDFFQENGNFSLKDKMVLGNEKVDEENAEEDLGAISNDVGKRQNFDSPKMPVFFKENGENMNGDLEMGEENLKIVADNELKDLRGNSEEERDNFQAKREISDDRIKNEVSDLNDIGINSEKTENDIREKARDIEVESDHLNENTRTLNDMKRLKFAKRRKRALKKSDKKKRKKKKKKIAKEQFLSKRFSNFPSENMKNRIARSGSVQKVELNSEKKGSPHSNLQNVKVSSQDKVSKISKKFVEEPRKIGEEAKVEASVDNLQLKNDVSRVRDPSADAELKYFENIHEFDPFMQQRDVIARDVGITSTNGMSARSVDEIQELLEKIASKVHELKAYVSNNDIQQRRIQDSSIPIRCDFENPSKGNPGIIPETKERCTILDNGRSNPIQDVKDRILSKRFAEKAQNLPESHNIVESKSRIDKRRSRKKPKSGPKWGKWTDWSSCSVTCGIGRKIRWRHCLRNCSKSESEMEEKACVMPSCPKKFLGIF